MSLATCTIETPLGPYALAAAPHGLARVAPARAAAARRGTDPRANAHLDAAAEALRAYFAGTRRDFADLDLVPAGSAFLLRVWQELRAIPYGATESYGALARRIGRPGAARAVGCANARNPLALVVPCHRVIGADGSLAGYAGGTWRKRWLLAHEGALPHAESAGGWRAAS
jgi:methylated-DNA-[protein]-cysteine S-methyltransferase